MLFLNDFLSDDLAIAEIHQAIGNIVIRFPLLHYQECAKTLKQWLKQRKIPGNLWRLSTIYDNILLNCI
ncbi:papain fold toxin domain-containing protein [Sphaerospermopsis sp. LEGE 08334]|uniref:papain fold toxin domain-containing protein n=1 Tax=Sphaerospermopsis sp. LEGE 08334 TaxID=1828651 RepID=UPI00187E0CC3|nr:papain fold toxin domain-containing protein [Sphaerospermopsis sp. LEGE 08334]MBE9058622.1 hypothetical protein [Sphaerospermopsis sp. LEGE 08334]